MGSRRLETSSFFVDQDEGCQVHLLIFIARRERVHSHVRWRGGDKQCNLCLGLSRCYKWILKLLPATIALGTLEFILVSRVFTHLLTGQSELPTLRKESK